MLFWLGSAKTGKHTAEDDAVGQAFLYTLTGEKSYLDPVKKTIEQWIAKPGSGPTTAGRAAVAVLS